MTTLTVQLWSIASWFHIERATQAIHKFICFGIPWSLGGGEGDQEHRRWHRHPFTVLPHYLSSSLPLPRVTSLSHFLFTPLLLFLATSSLRYISSSLTLCLVPHYLFTFVPRYLLTSLPPYLVTSLPSQLFTSLPFDMFTSLPPSLRPYFDTSLGSCIFAATPCCIVTSLPRDLFTSLPLLTHYLSSSLPRSLVTSSHRYLIASVLRSKVPRRCLVTPSPCYPYYLFTSTPCYILTTLPF